MRDKFKENLTKSEEVKLRDQAILRSKYEESVKILYEIMKNKAQKPLETSHNQILPEMTKENFDAIVEFLGDSGINTTGLPSIFNEYQSIHAQLASDLSKL